MSLQTVDMRRMFFFSLFGFAEKTFSIIFSGFSFFICSQCNPFVVLYPFSADVAVIVNFIFDEWKTLSTTPN